MHDILVLAALFAVELFGAVVVFPEWKRRHGHKHKDDESEANQYAERK